MTDEKMVFQLDTASIVNTVNNTLKKIDPRLVEHGERVAFFACSICEEEKLSLDMKKLFLLSIFHDIGAYKTDEIDRMLNFETTDMRNHSVYGYLFLKYMTPLKDCAQAVLYHHTAWDKIKDEPLAYKDYAALIHLADRLDIAMMYDSNHNAFHCVKQNAKGMFREDYVRLAEQCYKNKHLAEQIRDHSYQKKNEKWCHQFALSSEEIIEYLKLLVYAIDFRSEHTVTHTINTVSIAVNIAKHLNMDALEIEKIYFGALLHDIGKIAIPVEILEYPGRLNEEQMKIMRTHVMETNQLIRGIVPDEICDIAIRHHEKLDGTGYPQGLTAEHLTIPQRIVAVADIVSALASRRSYKEPFPKEKTISILQEMSHTQLDLAICAYVIDNYDSILMETDVERKQVIAMYQRIMEEFQKQS